MKATDILKQEHLVIERMLTCLERIVDAAAGGQEFDGQSADQTVQFFQVFADKCHHAKEEERLFPALERKGMPREMGPIGMMLHEHELGRAAVRGMAAEVPAARAADAAAAKRFSAHARGFIDLLREHIAKENGVLFPMADSLLSDEEQAEIVAQFAQAEVHDVGAGEHEKFLALVDQVAARYGVEPPTEALSAAHPCAHHMHNPSA